MLEELRPFGIRLVDSAFRNNLKEACLWLRVRKSRRAEGLTKPWTDTAEYMHLAHLRNCLRLRPDRNE